MSKYEIKFFKVKILSIVFLWATIFFYIVTRDGWGHRGE